MSTTQPSQAPLFETDIAIRDLPPVFAEWTEEQWRAAAGKILVIAVNPDTKENSFVAPPINTRDEFDVAAYVAEHPGNWIQFVQLPEAGSIGQPAE